MAFDLGISNQNDLVPEISQETTLVIVREARNKINKERLKSLVSGAILNFFNPVTNTLGQELSLSSLTSTLLSIEGIKRIETRNNNESISFKGVSLISYNPLYPSADIELVNQNITLPYFKFPYLINPNSLSSKIVIIDE